MKTTYQSSKNVYNDNNIHFDEEASINGTINWYGLSGGQSASSTKVLKALILERASYLF